MTGDKKVILIICHARSLDHTSQMFYRLDIVVGWEGGMTGDKKVILIICHARSLDHTSQMFHRLDI